MAGKNRKRFPCKPAEVRLFVFLIGCHQRLLEQIIERTAELRDRLVEIVGGNRYDVFFWIGECGHRNCLACPYLSTGAPVWPRYTNVTLESHFRRISVSISQKVMCFNFS